MGAMQEMMKNMGGGGMPGMGGAGGNLPDSDDEDEDEEEAAGDPMKPTGDGLGDLDGEAEVDAKKPAEAKEADPDLD